MSNETLKVSVLADISDFKTGMKQVQGELGNTNKSVGGFKSGFANIAKAATAAFTVTAIVAFGKKAVEATAELRALDAQFDQTFSGDSADAMKRINAQSEEMNINADRLKQGYSSFQGMFKGFGIEADSAMTLTDTSMRLAADAAAYYDKSLEDTSSSLKSFMMGNLTAGDAIGVNYTATMRDIDSKKKYGKAWKDLTQEQQAFLMTDVVSEIYEQSGAMGQASREGDSWENTTANLQATWNRFLELVGSPILDVLTVVLGKVSEGLQWVTTALSGVDFGAMISGSSVFTELWNSTLKPVFDAFAGVITNLAAKFQENMPAIQQFFSNMATGLKEAYETYIAPVFSTISEVIVYAIGKFSELASSISTFVNDTILPVIKNFIDMLKELYTENKDKFDKIQVLVDTVAEAIKNAIDGAVTFIKEKVLPFLKVIYEAIDENMGSIKKVFQNVLNTIESILDFFIAVFKGDWEGAWDAAKRYVTNIWETIKSIFQAAVDIANSIFKSFGIDIGAIWESITTTIGNAVENIKSGISSKFEAVKQTVTTIFENIKSAITNPIEAAKDTISNVIDKIKGLFNFTWSLPALKMPHFSVAGKFGLNPLSVPKLDLSWYSRGGIFTKPTVLNGIGVGDASNGHGSAAEVVAPLSDLKQMLGLSDKERNITINMNGSYSFRDREDMDYFSNRLALAARRV